MLECLKFYIDGEWTDPAEHKTLDVASFWTTAHC
jgi:hypothetical protein